MKKTLKKKGISEKYLKTHENENSFLIETTFNSAIDITIRKEIEVKYRKSKINSEYVFPRVQSLRKTSKKLISKKPSLETLGKLVNRHKQTRSTIQPLNSEGKSIEKILNKHLFTVALASNRDDKPKTLTHYRGLSYRSLKTDRNFESKSPKSTKNIEINHKSRSGTSKKTATNDFSNKQSSAKKPPKVLTSAGSLRLKKLFLNVKNSFKV